jgi:hypothetical protein
MAAGMHRRRNVPREHCSREWGAVASERSFGREEGRQGLCGWSEKGGHMKKGRAEQSEWVLKGSAPLDS